MALRLLNAESKMATGDRVRLGSTFGFSAILIGWKIEPRRCDPFRICMTVDVWMIWAFCPKQLFQNQLSDFHVMTKTKTYAQLKAKKAWLLHKPSTKKPRCRPPNKPRENKNMATDAMEKRTSLPSTSGDKEKAESGTVCSLLGGSPHHDEDSPALALAAPRSEDIKRKRRFYSPVVESFYNFMAFGYQGLKGIGIVSWCESYFRTKCKCAVKNWSRAAVSRPCTRLSELSPYRALLIKNQINY